MTHDQRYFFSQNDKGEKGGGMIKKILESICHYASFLSVSLYRMYVFPWFASSYLTVISFDCTNTFDVVPIESIEFLDEKLSHVLNTKTRVLLCTALFIGKAYSSGGSSERKWKNSLLRPRSLEIYLV